MKNLITLAKALFKPLAVVKYLCFPFMMAQAQDTIDFKAVTGGEQITAQVEVENTVWLSTTNGIYQVNKKSGKTSHLTTQNSVLPSNNVKGLCSTANGNIYAATDKGIFRFDGYGFMVISTENAKLPTNNITSIACDENGRIFMGTEGHGLIMMEGYRTQIFNKNNSDLTANGVKKVYIDENGLMIAELSNGHLVAMGSTTMVLIPNQTPDVNATATAY